MKNKISIIIGIYFPYSALFRKCLDSCLQQDMSGLEFIFLLDAPDDIESRQILSEYKEKFDQNENSFIIIENKKNMGVYWNQMSGLNIATGEYIVFFDDDDFFDNDYLSTIHEYAKKFDANVIKGHALTHFYGQMDLNFIFLCKETSTFNNDDWCYMYKTIFLKRYFDHKTMYTSDTKNFTKIDNNKMSLEFILEVPLWEGTFYHYIRHNKNTSNVLFSKSNSNIKSDISENQLKINLRFLNALESILPNSKTFSNSEIENILKKRINWDNDNIVYKYDDIKGL